MKVLNNRPIGSLMFIHVWNDREITPILVKEHLKNDVVSVIRLLPVVYGWEWITGTHKGYTLNEYKKAINREFYEGV